MILTRTLHAAIIIGLVAAFVSAVAVLFALVASIPSPLLQQIAVGSAALLMALCPALAIMLLVKITRSPITWFDHAFSAVTSLCAIPLLRWMFASVVHAASAFELSRGGSAILVVVGCACALIGSVEIWRRTV